MTSILRKLRRKAPTKRPVVPLRSPRFTRAQQKMSEVVLDFAGPFLEDASDEDSYKMAISFAILCWNIALHPEQEQEQLLGDVLGDLLADQGKAAKNDPASINHFQTIGRLLLLRKRTLFPNNTRAILSYEIVEKGDATTILVTSALDPPAPAKGS